MKVTHWAVTICFIGAGLLIPSVGFSELYKYRTPEGQILVTNQRRPNYDLLSVLSAKPNSQKQKSTANKTQDRSKTLTRRARYNKLIKEAASKYDVPEAFIKAVIKIESNFDPNAISSAGAQGLMQLMPSTANNLGVENPFNPRENIFGGTKLLSNLIKRYDGNIELILAAYNAGDVAVQKYNGIPYPKTKKYVELVYKWFKIYSERSNE